MSRKIQMSSHGEIRMPGLRNGEKANGEVKEYRLSEKELAKYRALKPEKRVKTRYV